MSEKKVGELNGKWSILFRALMATIAIMIPFIVAMGSWATVSLFHLQRDIALMRMEHRHFISDFEELKSEVDYLKKNLPER